MRDFSGEMRLSPNVVDAATVIAAEKDQIAARRARVAPQAPAGLFGVSFSGGGIRSATLHLGILQGLARRGLLPYFDYLSTVSGGGYIGAWLHGVIRRYGRGDPCQILNLLSRPDQSPPHDSEHDPIAFLRKFSSYLAPDLGLFSADAWVILIIWLRNIALNLTILFPFAAAITLALLEIGYVRAWVNWPVEWVAAIAAALVLAVVFVVGNGVWHVVRKEDCRRDHLPPRPTRDGIGPAVLSTSLMMLASTLLACLSPLLGPARWVLPPLFATLLVLFLALEIEGGFLACYAQRHTRSSGGWLLLVLFATVSAAVTAAMFYGMMCWIKSWNPVSEQASWRVLAWGPPLLMLVVLAGAGLLIGLMGVDFPDFGREWLSRIGAFLAIGAFAWASLYAVMIFGPYWMAWLAVYYGKTAFALASGWAGTTLAGVLSAYSARTGGNAKNGDGKILEVIARIAPPVFMVGFLMLAAAAVHAGIAAWSGNLCASDFVDAYWCALDGQESSPVSLAMLGAAIAVMMFMQWRVNINEFSMAHFYKNRLVRCYLGASRGMRRRGSLLTGFDPCDDLEITSLLADPGKPGEYPYYGPYPIINTTINLNTGSEMAKRERRGSSFVFTPLYSGYVPPRSAEEVEFSEVEGAPPRGYRATHGYAEPFGPQIGTCMAISGAAANPDMGFHTSAPVAFLLTVFDVRLGWWLGNTRFDQPSAKPGPTFALHPLLSELFAQTDARSKFVNLSDGGHFENLGLYELVRRGCRYIIAGDGDQDNDYTFESLGGAVRKCRADFGVEIDIDPQGIRPHGQWSRTHYAVGRIHYPDGTLGWLLYLQSSMTGDEPADVMQYKASHPDFPQETTANQFFTEDQFESYRRLGLHIADSAFAKVSVVRPGDPEWMEKLFESLATP